MLEDSPPAYHRQQSGSTPFVSSTQLVVDPLAQSILQEISAAHQNVAQQVVSWWFRKMPEAYFREIVRVFVTQSCIMFRIKKRV